MLGREREFPLQFSVLRALQRGRAVRSAGLLTERVLSQAHFETRGQAIQQERFGIHVGVAGEALHVGGGEGGAPFEQHTSLVDGCTRFRNVRAVGFQRLRMSRGRIEVVRLRILIVQEFPFWGSPHGPVA